MKFYKIRRGTFDGDLRKYLYAEEMEFLFTREGDAYKCLHNKMGYGLFHNEVTEIEESSLNQEEKKFVLQYLMR